MTAHARGARIHKLDRDCLRAADRWLKTWAAATRTQANYDGWWNGGMCNTATYHNTIALLTEIIGTLTPMEIALIPEADRVGSSEST